MSQPFGSSPEFNNPFSPPGSQSPNAGPQLPPRPSSKPTVAMVFGILNLVFGASGLLFQGLGVLVIVLFREKLQELAQQPIAELSATQWIGTGVQLLLTAWVIYSGLRVLGGTMAGRAAFMQYCIASLLIRPFLVGINAYAQYEQMQQQMQAGAAAAQPAVALGFAAVIGVFSLIFAEAYEAIGFFVMRSKGITQQFEAWDQVVNGPQNNQSFNFR